MDELNRMIISIEKHIESTGNFFIGDILKRYNGNDWLNHIDHSTTGLTRNKIYISNDIEVIILSWNSGYETLPHDHSKNGCWLKMLKGNVIETPYRDNQSNLIQTGETNLIKEGHISFMCNDFGYHSIKNDTEDIVFSLHIYSPPLHKTKYFSV